MITTAGAELTKENLVQAQKEDPILQEVRGWVERDIHPEKQELAGKDEDLRTYAQLRDTLTIHHTTVEPHSSQIGSQNLCTLQLKRKYLFLGTRTPFCRTPL